MKKVCIVTSSRADFSKLEPLYVGLANNPRFKVMLVVSGAHLLLDSGLTVQEIESKYEIAAKAYTVVSGDSNETMTESVALGISKFSTIFVSLNPDFVVVHGDRFDALAVAIASSLLSICTVHIEGGELSGTIDGSLRHAITKLCHLHFVSNAQALGRLLSLGEEPSHVFLTGCPSYDKFSNLKYSNEEEIAILSQWRAVSNQYAIVVHHPDTNFVESTLKEYKEILDFMSNIEDRALFFYPNIDPGNKRMIKLLNGHRKAFPALYSQQITIVANVPGVEFAVLLKHATCIVGNSSAGVREACFFGTPSIVIGTRQSGRDLASNAVEFILDGKSSLVETYMNIRGKRFAPAHLYGDGHAVPRMIECLENFDPSNVAKIFYEPSKKQL